MSKAAKADMLLATCSVKPYRVSDSPRGVRALVTSEHGTYDTAAWFDSRGRLTYHCTCDYSDHHPVRMDCAHALAVAKLV